MSRVLEEIARNDVIKGQCWADLSETVHNDCLTWETDPVFGKTAKSTPATHPSGLCDKHAEELLP